MKVDKFTKIIMLKNLFFIYNTKTGNIDEIGKEIADEIDLLINKNSFTPLECNFGEALIEEMIDRGYITYYSDREEVDERKWFIEKHIDKVKKLEKTVSIIIDNVVGENWCYKSKFINNTGISKDSFSELLKNVRDKNIARKVDLWLQLKNRMTDWEWIEKEIKSNGLEIHSIYSFVRNKTELHKIKNWMSITLSAPKTIHIKYEKKEFEYLKLIKNDNNSIRVKNDVIFISKHPFFCPFIYRTFFINERKNISYCMKKLVDKEVFEKNEHLKREDDIGNNLSKKLFSTNCDKSDNCIYSIYCSKMCPYLSYNYENMNENECSLVKIFDKLLKTKINSIV